MERKAKEKVVEELEDKLKRAGALFIAEYSGMSVAQISKLRRELDNVGGEFKVAKNTLLKIASTGTQAEAIQDQFAGPNAVIYSYKDPVGVAKVLAATTKDVPKLKLKTGLLGKQRLGAQEIQALSTIPPKEVLVGKLLGLLMSMPQRLVGALSGNIMQLMLTLNAIKSQKEGT
ncbi:MAG: 50S ribosomal protein L10 [Syntrophorhabdaceae bacterium PtaU1.Bin034]|nr:MAG: 50S ribosomal protein L10 [Syntrophorhabdaceae bacterium PtaU1.Bin034]